MGKISINKHFSQNISNEYINKGFLMALNFEINERKLTFRRNENVDNNALKNKVRLRRSTEI